MIYAFRTGSSKFQDHDKNYGYFSIKLNADGSCNSAGTAGGGNIRDVSTIHGWIMWVSWTVIGLFQIITARYLTHWWKWSGFLHNFLGLLAGTATLFASLLMLKHLNFSFYFSD